MVCIILRTIMRSCRKAGVERMIGIRAHDLGKMPVRELARKISEKGFDCTHLALQKAITDYDFSLGKLNPGMAKEIRKHFIKKCFNLGSRLLYKLVHPDEKARREQLDRFKEHIRVCKGLRLQYCCHRNRFTDHDWSYTRKTTRRRLSK